MALLNAKASPACTYGILQNFIGNAAWARSSFGFYRRGNSVAYNQN
jgi:hypothetical protein